MLGQWAGRGTSASKSASVRTGQSAHAPNFDLHFSVTSEIVGRSQRSGMSVIRHIIRCWRLALFALLCVGLGLNSLVPAGYMIAPSSSGWLTVVICPETHPLARWTAPKTDHNMMDHAAMGHGDMSHAAMEHGHMGHDDGSGASGSQANECAFAGVSKQDSSALDLYLLALAIAFALLLGLSPRSPIRLPKLANLRPPLRGPPSYA